MRLLTVDDANDEDMDQCPFCGKWVGDLSREGFEATADATKDVGRSRCPACGNWVSVIRLSIYTLRKPPEDSPASVRRTVDAIESGEVLISVDGKGNCRQVEGDASYWRRAYEDAYRALKHLDECCGQEIAEYQSPEDVQTILGFNGRVHSINGWDVPDVSVVPVKPSPEDLYGPHEFEAQPADELCAVCELLKGDHIHGHPRPAVPPHGQKEWAQLAALVEETIHQRDALAEFKAYVHRRLDEAGVPVDPESPHKAEGCRIGGRLDVVFAERDALRTELAELRVACRDMVLATMDARRVLMKRVTAAIAKAEGKTETADAR